MDPCDAVCPCVGTYGPNPDCGKCGGDGCISRRDAERLACRDVVSDFRKEQWENRKWKRYS